MKITTSLRMVASALPIAFAAACSKSSSTVAPLPADVQALRASLEPYSSFALAKNAGYTTMLTDCMSNGDIGAMGIHYGNPAYIDGVADPLHPEALIFEPGNDGSLSLVGVEFLVPFSAVPKTAPAPELFGQKFVVNDVFGVWALHVWTHRANPSGLFASWNPRVHC
jgi:hypothetical protein